jgi:hypothetical protein
VDTFVESLARIIEVIVNGAFCVSFLESLECSLEFSYVFLGFFHSADPQSLFAAQFVTHFLRFPFAICATRQRYCI